MNAAKWILIGMYALSILVTIAKIGQPREPTTPGVAVGTVVLGAFMIFLVVIA